MFKSILTSLLAIALLLISRSSVAETPQQITESMDILQKETACVLVTDYAIRHLNLFVTQLEMVNNTNGERQKLILPLIEMAVAMQLDADKRKAELISSGIDESYIDAKLKEVADEILSRYSIGYIASTDYSKAEAFIQTVLSEQEACEAWAKATLGGAEVPDQTPPAKKDNGGING